MFTIVLDYNDTRDLGTMKLLSINVGLPREIERKEKTVRTSIFKEPVQGRVRVAQLNLEGDRQSDLSLHAGIDKAVRVSIGALPILAQGTSWNRPSVGNFRRELHHGRLA